MTEIKQLMLANMRGKFGYIAQIIPQGKLIQQGNMQLVDCGKNSDTFNTVVGVPSSLKEIRQVTDYYLGKNLSAAWWLQASRLDDSLKKNLSVMGWQWAEKEVGMSYDVPGAVPIYKKPKLKIVQCKTPQDFEKFGVVLSSVFEEGNSVEAENVRQVYKFLSREETKNLDKMIFLLAYEDNVPVGTMTLYFSHNLAGLFDLSVLPEKRRNGYGSEMFNYSLHTAKEKRVKTCVLAASEKGLHIYECAGFKFLEEFCIWNLQSL